MSDLQHITAQFLGNRVTFSFSEITEGLINKTYKAKTSEGKQYILQQVNQLVFKNVPKLMQNLEQITKTLSRWIKESDLAIKSFHYLPTLSDKKLYFQDSDANYWRLSDYIDNTPLSQLTDKPKIAEESGRLFGYFVKALADIDLEKIHTVIPNFHNTELYFEKLENAIENGNKTRLSESTSILDKINSYKWLIQFYLQIRENKNIPSRLVHSDTKSSNILYDNDANAIAVIDLDTSMSGFIMADFGDAIRSLTNTGKEDDEDLGNVSFNLNLFEKYTKGFLSATHDFIHEEEKEALANFALLITYEQAIRFYTDYLNDDAYYQTKYTEHNLQRTKAQLKLLDDMERQLDKMKEIVERLS